MHTRESFLKELTSAKARDAAARLLDVAQESGASIGWGSSGLSIRTRCSLWPYPVSVAWLFPPSKLGFLNLKLISFGAAIFGYDPPPGEKLRLFLEQWVGQFSTDDYCEDVSGLGAKAWSVDYDVAAQHIDLLGDRLSKVLLELKSL